MYHKGKWYITSEVVQFSAVAPRELLAVHKTPEENSGLATSLTFTILKPVGESNCGPQVLHFYLVWHPFSASVLKTWST